MLYQLSYQDSLEREGYICGYDDDMNVPSSAGRMLYQLSYQDSLEREGYICGYDDDMNLLCAGHKLSSECIMMIWYI